MAAAAARVAAAAGAATGVDAGEKAQGEARRQGHNAPTRYILCHIDRDVYDDI